MSQVLINKPKNAILYSEIYFPRKQSVLRSSVAEASCHICKQELKEGIGLTAKRIGNKTVLVCGLHC
jgi:hypothetical protein